MHFIIMLSPSILYPVTTVCKLLSAMKVSTLSNAQNNHISTSVSCGGIMHSSQLFHNGFKQEVIAVFLRHVQGLDYLHNLGYMYTGMFFPHMLLCIILLSKAILMHPFSTTLTCTLQPLPHQLTILIEIILVCIKTHSTLVA